MRGSKFIAVLLTVAVVLAGGAQALAVVPHVHGHDADHSAHSTCPVHQAQLASFCAPEVSGSSIFAAEPCDFHVEAADAGLVPQNRFFQGFLRAPPSFF